MIRVLGSGCPTCEKLYLMTRQAVSELELDEDIEYITGVEGSRKIVELGLMTSPVLVVNKKVVMVGFTPDIEKIKKNISEALNKK